MAHVLALTIRKDGVGKTTTALSLGIALARHGADTVGHRYDRDNGRGVHSGEGVDRWAGGAAEDD